MTAQRLKKQACIKQIRWSSHSYSIFSLCTHNCVTALTFLFVNHPCLTWVRYSYTYSRVGTLWWRQQHERASRLLSYCADMVLRGELFRSCVY